MLKTVGRRDAAIERTTYRDVLVSREAEEGETYFTGIARVERLAWAMPDAKACAVTRGPGWLLKTVGRRDAAIERTGRYLQRVLSSHPGPRVTLLRTFTHSIRGKPNVFLLADLHALEIFVQ